MHFSRLGASFLSVLILTGVAANSAHGQQPPEAAADKKGGDVESARVHYERGLKLYDEENYDAALTEIERAYKIAPSYKLLYVMARIQRHQNNYAAALTNFRAYLRDGGTSLPSDRRQEVEGEINTLTLRCATIELKSNVNGADISIDDVPLCTGSVTADCTSKTPLPRPIIVNPGRRRISVTKSGYVTASTLVTVVGSDAVAVKLDLVPVSSGQSSKVLISDPGARNRAIGLWALTGGLAIGAAVTGVIALGKADTLKQHQNEPESNADLLNQDSRDAKKFAIVSDVLTGSAVIGGVLATYFTIDALRDPVPVGAGSKSAKLNGVSRVAVQVGPTGARLSGHF